VNGLVAAGSGHRPGKLGGYSAEAAARLDRFALATLRDYQPERLISGMALGWDQALARAALALGVPVTAAVPFEGQDALWPAAARDEHARLLSLCDEVVVVCPGGYAPRKMLQRDRWMVDRCTTLLALWNGSPGGTGGTVAYAAAGGRVLVANVWDEWLALAGRPAGVDFRLAGESLARRRTTEAELGEAAWSYRCLAGAGCPDNKTWLRLPAHMLRCSCELPWHGSREVPSHGRPCGAPVELTSRTPAARALDEDGEEEDA
jgi:hypothetical protein